MGAIDSDALKEYIKKTDLTAVERGALLQAISNMPTLTPPNEPLTLDELRKMKDEPTYLKVFDPLLKSGWHIVKAVTEDKIIFRDWQTVYVPIDGMGVDYNLYRRPPEGKEDIK